MRIFHTKKVTNKKNSYFEKHFFNKPVFYDIETTGFSRDYHMIYMIGIGQIEDNHITSTQLLAEQEQDEPVILREFFKRIAGSDLLISYNGKRFDLPFILARAKKFDIPLPSTLPPELDLYLEAKPIFRFLSVPDQKLKTMERFFHISREDQMSGKELIEVFKNYQQKHDEKSEQLLLCHNAEDILNLPDLMQLLTLKEAFQMDYMHNFTSSVEEFNGTDGNTKKELSLVCPHHLPVYDSYIFYGENYFLRIDQNTIRMQIPILSGRLLYFFDNYKDYYYLPAEDKAIHKSVASFVPPENRQKAKANNCYQQYEGDFLPNPKGLITPAFYEHYKGDKIYLSLQESKDTLLDHMKEYITSILEQ
ncbi:MAG: ribonuclease H-like domain-containing protein [Eubacterium sp.]|nr:ribonuclease H-like domain-containing protein [Eubacterium sp.]